MRVGAIALPNLSNEDVSNLFPEADEISVPFRGGQKLVFPCRIGRERFAVKVMLSDGATDDEAGEASGTPPTDEIYERAKLEVSILENCDCDNLPKIGPIGLRKFEHGGQQLIAFSEEFITGQNLHDIILNDGPLNDQSAIQLGEDLTSAVKQIWAQQKIHRDIKPRNIVRRDQGGQFVLVDAGIAFDLDDVSLSRTLDDLSLSRIGEIWHTKGYLAPELSNLDRKREADCRSDFFLIGTVLYEVTTGRHPFVTGSTLDRTQAIANILNLAPPPPHEVRPEMSCELSGLIMRLLSKRRQDRFKNCGMLRSALAECKRSLES